MGLRSTVAMLAVGASLTLAAETQAASSVYVVTGTADSGLATCRPLASVPSGFQCDSLRAAVTAANAFPGEGDVIFLSSAGDYVVNQALDLTDTVTITGRGPRTTAVRGSGTSRVFTVAAGVTVGLYRLAVAGGQAGGGDGGNILNSGSLVATSVRVTGGSAANGGGIANLGAATLFLSNSLVDHNAANGGIGGGILNRSSTGDGGLLAINSTIGFNTAVDGGGIGVDTSANNTSLISVTIARNSVSNAAGGGGIFLANTNGSADAEGSLLASNTVVGGTTRNCAGLGSVFDSSAANNRENGTSCDFQASGAGITVSPDLVNDGGDTDLFTFPPTSPAKGVVAPCFNGTDQRQAPRPSSACDVGAYEQGAVAPPITDVDPFPITVPPPVDQAPVPTPVQTPIPTPVPNKTVVVKEIKGTVRIKLPGGKGFVDLDATQGIPVGSEVDTKKGTVEITAVPAAGKPPEKAQFYDGIFKISQKSGITDLKLTEPLATCPKNARAAAKKPKTRKLWGDGKGKFRTSGKYSAATVRGTKWLVEDSCKGTLTRVTVGSVLVHDNVKKKDIVVRKSYTARPRK